MATLDMAEKNLREYKFQKASEFLAQIMQFFYKLSKLTRKSEALDRLLADPIEQSE